MGRSPVSTVLCPACTGAWAQRVLALAVCGGRSDTPCNTGRRVAGAPREQVAFQPPNREDRTVGSWVRVAGRETRDPRAELWSAGEAGTIRLWWERNVAQRGGGRGGCTMQGPADSATVPRKKQESLVPRLGLGTRPGVITGAPCREVGVFRAASSLQWCQLGPGWPLQLTGGWFL